jgi:hypothetical protein
MTHMTMRLGNPATPSTSRFLGWCLVAVLALLAVPSAASAAVFPYIDVNSNGRWDRGVDSGDITQQLVEQGGVTTPHSIVIPGDRNELVAKHRQGLTLIAGRNILVNRSVRASTMGANIVMVSQQGSITIGAGVSLKAPSTLSFDAAGDVVFGADSMIASRPLWGERSVVTVQAGGDVLVMHGAVVMANHEVQMVALRGAFTAERGAGVVANKGDVELYGAQRVSVVDGTLKGRLTTLTTDGEALELRGSQVHAVSGGNVGVYILASAATVNLKGTVFYGLDTNDIVVDAANVVK